MALERPEHFSPARCPVAQQYRPGPHQDTAGDKRKKWTRQDNENVTVCYLRSEPKRREHRKKWLKNGEVKICLR